MNNPNATYFYLFKGEWQERFLEMISLFQISLHKKFVISVPEDATNEYNRVFVQGISSPQEHDFIETEVRNCATADDASDQQINALFHHGDKSYIGRAERVTCQPYRSEFSFN